MPGTLPSFAIRSNSCSDAPIGATFSMASIILAFSFVVMSAPKVAILPPCECPPALRGRPRNQELGPVVAHAMLCTCAQTRRVRVGDAGLTRSERDQDRG